MPNSSKNQYGLIEYLRDLFVGILPYVLEHRLKSLASAIGSLVLTVLGLLVAHSMGYTQFVEDQRGTVIFSIGLLTAAAVFVLLMSVIVIPANMVIQAKRKAADAAEELELYRSGPVGPLREKLLAVAAICHKAAESRDHGRHIVHNEIRSWVMKTISAASNNMILRETFGGQNESLNHKSPPDDSTIDIFFDNLAGSITGLADGLEKEHIVPGYNPHLTKRFDRRAVRIKCGQSVLERAAVTMRGIRNGAISAGDSREKTLQLVQSVLCRDTADKVPTTTEADKWAGEFLNYLVEVGQGLNEDTINPNYLAFLK